ncbi:MAG: hypothetical protein ACE5R4_05035 [Armatimonadota bacterium]
MPSLEQILDELHELRARRAEEEKGQSREEILRCVREQADAAIEQYGLRLRPPLTRAER